MYEIQLHPFVFSALISLFLLWFITKWFHKPNGNKNLPPSPPKLPIIGNIHQLGSLPHRSLQSLGRKHGPLMLLHFGNVPVLIVSSADAAREIMRTHDLTFADRPQLKAFKKLLYDCKVVGFCSYGECWRQMRSIFVIQLLSNKRVQSFRSIREEETAVFVKQIGESFGGLVNLSDMFAEFTNDVICRTAFGRKYRESENGEKLLLLLKELMEFLGATSIGDFIPWLSWIDRVSGLDEKLDRVAKEIDDFLEDVIQERVVEIEKGHDVVDKNGENFVDIILGIQNETASGVFIGRDNIKALLVEVFIAGTDTISITLEWVMTELLRHPIVMKKLQNEVREIVKDKRVISDDDIEKMHYMKAVIKETFRYHPPGPLVPRVAREDVKIKGYDISAGTMVMINAWAIGRDEMSWEEPKKFRPERFINSSIDIKGLNFELIPFGAGRRGCPGLTYAMATIELLLANLVQKFNWKLPNGVEAEYLDISESPGLSIRRAIPLLAVATKTP